MTIAEFIRELIQLNCDWDTDICLVRNTYEYGDIYFIPCLEKDDNGTLIIHT